MASTYSNLGIELIGAGEQTGTWGTTTNTNLGTLIDQAIGGYATYACTGTPDTITIPNGATGVARNMYLKLTGTGGSTLTVPTNTKLYFIFNSTASAITVKTSGAGVSVPAGAKTVLLCDGTDIVVAENYLASLTLGTPLTVASGGSGVATAAAYSVLCGGTTSTGPIQAIANVGTAGQVLTSNGAGALPTMQTITSFVAGMIMLWSGSSASIPTGWLLCDGTSSTPNLRDRFVVGAGSTYAVNATGGTADAVVVTHTHVATDAGHTHTQSYVTFQNPASTGGGAAYGATTTNTGTGYASITNAVPVGSVSGTNQNLPPYYALCYIMKS